MKTLSRVMLSALALSVACAALPARAQCPAWKSGFHVNGTDGDVFALTTFDEGSGPKLYAGGRFTSASGVSAQDIAVWNGSAWSALGAGIVGGSSGGVLAVAPFDDGSGSALYAAGSFLQAGGAAANNIAKWDGSAWSPLGGGIDGIVDHLAVFDDGSGPALYAAGTFAMASGVTVNNIAKWNGSAWSALGSGLGGVEYPEVASLAVFDDGSGAALFAAGTFLTAGGVAASNIAKWNGSTWSALGAGTDAQVNTLAVFDDGAGSELYAAGLFAMAGGVSVPGLARWNGSSWSAYGANVGTNGFVRELAVFDDGSGDALYACGSFTSRSGAASIAKWNGTDWAPLGTGIHAPAFAMFVFDDGSGARLAVGGEYGFAGGVPANNIAAWSGSSWSAIGDGEGVNNTVVAMLPFDDGSGPALFVGGAFGAAGIATPSCIAKWDGTAWTPLSSGMSVTTTTPAEVSALAVFDDGSGPALYAGGYFSTAGGVAAANIAKWDGSAWSALGGGIGGATFSRVDVLTVFDGALYAGGNFTTAGGAPANYIARWDGSSWSALGSGMDGVPSAISVGALAVFDDGSGPALYAGGSFTSAGGIHAADIAKWNGSAWSPVGGSTNHVVESLAVFDDGSGAQLYAGGVFTMAGSTAVQHIARWNGSTWSAVGLGLSSTGTAVVGSLAVFDDGAGLALFAGGTFTSSGSVTTNEIARWDGTAWSAVGAGVSDFFGGQPAVLTLAAFGGASSRAIYAGGLFTKAGGKYSHFIGAWSACPDAALGVPFCFGDGTEAACPCGNFGLPGHGCKNSSSVRGAELTAAGYSSLATDTVVLTSTFENHNATSVFLQGAHSIAPVFFGDGLRCAGGALKRLYVVNASSTGTVSAPTGSLLPISARSAALGDEILAGETRVYQVYYRDSSLTFCPAPMGSTFNVSQALRILWTP
jgi:hypothetical protein